MVANTYRRHINITPPGQACRLTENHFKRSAYIRRKNERDAHKKHAVK